MTWQGVRRIVAAARESVPRMPKYLRPRYAFIPGLAALAFLIALYVSIAVSLTPPPRMIEGFQGLQLVDREGKPIFSFERDPGSHQVISLDQVSPYVVDATVATEDHDFWRNPGLNIRGIARAIYENLAFWEYGGFFKGSGGSGLTQQLAKNLYIRSEERSRRSPLRKLKEAIIAIELNRRYSKAEILAWYLSDLNYGNGAYGIEAAAYRYFSKPAAELTLSEATLLAGIPRAPAIYDPIGNPEAALARQRDVLALMVRHGFLEKEAAEQAMASPPALREGRPPAGGVSTLAPHFAVYVRDQLPALIGRKALEGHLRVTTTIDSRLQEQAESIVRQQMDRLERQLGVTNGALVAIDPRTGEVLALVGSPDFYREDISGQVNNATALNNPGSTMKPFTYLAAFLKGWAPATIIEDAPLTINNGERPYVLRNADGWYRGPVSARVALGSSLNVPAVKALNYAGLQQVYDTAKQFGLTTLGDLSNYGPAFTLGGVDVTLLDLTYAYSVFANYGERAGMDTVLDLPPGSRRLDPVTVLKVENEKGQVIWEWEPRKERVVAANATYLVTHVLADDSARASMFGLNSPLNLGRPAAAKSGSSDDYVDLWTIGYTPTLVTGVWVGNANNRPVPGATSTSTAAVIWRAFMQAALQGQPVQDFPVPEGVQFVDVCATTGTTPTAACPRLVREVFLAGRAPATAVPPTPTPRDERRENDDRRGREPTPTTVPRQDLLPTFTPRPAATPTPPATATPPRASPPPSPTPAPTTTPVPTFTMPPLPTSPPPSPQPPQQPRGGSNRGSGDNGD